MKDPGDLDPRELIIGLRGGVPSKCDFCQRETAPERLHPEEAGDWACQDCVDRWHREDLEHESK